MTIQNHSAFRDISKNNELVDQSIDSLVELAYQHEMDGAIESPIKPNEELKKTAQLLLLSSLLQNHTDEVNN